MNLQTLVGSSISTPDVIPQNKVSSAEVRNKYFKAKSLKINGQMSVDVPGFETYDVRGVLIEYHSMAVGVNGVITEEKRGGMTITDGRIHVLAKRSNPAENALYKEDRLHLFDPDITLYPKSGSPFKIRQAQGIPTVNVSQGYLSFTK